MDDNILFIKKNDSDSLIVKTILRCFEMASGLKVNFHKSSLVGNHVDQREINIYASALNCATI